ncbi:MAG: hypothetical protein GY868_21000, partial [Deltaproteobacteria bacterium]|nr:hypothetical protein [Deltaproteobacteria bacterium]
MTRDVKIIEPVAFRPGKKRLRGRRTLPLKWLMPALVAGGLLLSVAVWFVFTASQIEILITPEPDRIFIKGRLLRLRIGKAFLLRPGT